MTFTILLVAIPMFYLAIEIDLCRARIKKLEEKLEEKQ
jgi:hypothetical protein